MRKKGTIAPDALLTSRELGSGEKVMMAYLINREDNSGVVGGENPNQEEIAKAFGMTTVAISNLLKRLVDKDYLFKQRMKGYNNRFKNFYQVNWEKIESLEEK